MSGSLSVGVTVSGAAGRTVGHEVGAAEYADLSGIHNLGRILVADGAHDHQLPRAGVLFHLGPQVNRLASPTANSCRPNARRS